MRMRKKKNLDDRIEAVKEILHIPAIEEKNTIKALDINDYINTELWFGNNNPVFLEIGCGKGKFAIELAKKNPDINIIAVEKSSNVIVEGCKNALSQNIPNLRFLKCGAEYLLSYFKEKSFERIYLNFSCPFPKKSYASHRLTHNSFLKIYDKLLTQNGEIHQKTDNKELFEFSIEQLSGYGFRLKNISLDLHSSNFQGNIVTEYEKRFSEIGMPIYRLEAFIAQ